MNFEQLTASTVDFVRANQGWAPLIVGLLAFGESLALISLLIPATVLLLAIGAVIGGAGLDFWPIWTAAVVGAFLGDWVSYEVARHYGDAIKHSWPLNRQTALVDRAEAMIRKYGVWGIFIGRFFGPLRALVPLVAGIFEMARLPFQAANLASALIWATGMLAPGAGLMEWLRG